MNSNSNRRFAIRFVYEHIYNHYEGVSLTKVRPYLVWSNKVKCVQHSILCFYCSTKIDKFNPDACIKLNSKVNPHLKRDTYVWLHKPTFILTWDLINYLRGEVSDKNNKDDIRTKLSAMYENIFSNNIPIKNWAEK